MRWAVPADRCSRAATLFGLDALFLPTACGQLAEGPALRITLPSRRWPGAPSRRRLALVALAPVQVGQRVQRHQRVARRLGELGRALGALAALAQQACASSMASAKRAEAGPAPARGRCGIMRRRYALSLPGSSAITESVCAIASSLSTSDSAWRPSSVSVGDGDQRLTAGLSIRRRSSGAPAAPARSAAGRGGGGQRLVEAVQEEQRIARLVGRAADAGSNSIAARQWRIQRCRARFLVEREGQRAGRIVQPVACEGLRDARRAQHWCSSPTRAARASAHGLLQRPGACMGFGLRRLVALLAQSLSTPPW